MHIALHHNPPINSAQEYKVKRLEAIHTKSWTASNKRRIFSWKRGYNRRARRAHSHIEWYINKRARSSRTGWEHTLRRIIKNSRLSARARIVPRIDRAGGASASRPDCVIVVLVVAAAVPRAVPSE